MTETVSLHETISNGFFPRRSVPPTPRENTAWRAYFDRAVHTRAMLPWGGDYLRRDIASALRRVIPQDARVLEVGSGSGATLAALPNAHRAGIDLTPAAVERARGMHPDIDFSERDALDFVSDDRWDAIVCDRLVHSVPDVQRLLENLGAHLAPGGRIFLTTFNYLWEMPVRLAETLGFKLPSPEANWLSESDLANLFAIADLEVVKYDDRMVLPLPLPVVSTVLNRWVGKLPGIRKASLYRMYVLRRREPVVSRVPTVTVVVPARNEAGNIPSIVARTPVMGAGTELIFVEGGSTDGTRDAIALALRDYRGPLTLASHTQRGKGKGDAVRVGFGEAKGDILMILDADLTVPPEDLPKFYDVLVQGKADYAHGTRLVYPMESQAMRFLNKLGNIGFSKLFTYLLNQPIKDTLCGTKVLWARDYARLAANRGFFGDFDPFGDFDLIFGASRLNLRIVEIPIRYRDRTYGSTNISRFRHGWLLLRMSMVAATRLKFV